MTQPAADGRPRWLVTLAPAGLYLLLRGAGILLYWSYSTSNDRPIDLHAWDGDWYLQIARHGYLGVDPAMLDLHGHHDFTTPMVFFPGYPLVVKLASFVCGGSFLVAAVLVSGVAGLVAAYGVARLATRITDSRTTALITVVLFSAAPMSIVYSMAYPEALLCALATWCLVGLLERRWWLAIACVVAAGYVSPMAAPLILVVMAAAFLDVFRRGRGSAAVAAMVAPAGMLAYLLWTVAQTNMRGNYFTIQAAGWGSTVDYGWSTAIWVWQTFARDTNAFVLAQAVLAAGAAGLLVAAYRPMRAHWPVWLYCLLTVAMVDGTNGIMWDKGRLLLCAFPLLIPIAARLAGRRPPVAAAWTAAFVFAGLWLSAYSLTAWHYSI